MTGLLNLVILTLRDPAGGFAALRARRVQESEAWAMLLLAAALSGILGWFGTQVAPEGPVGPLGLLASHPLGMAAVQIGTAALFAVLLARVGQMFGGRGSFADALLATAWLELVMLVVQVPQLLLAMVQPTLAGIVGLLTFVLYLYLAVQLTRAVHGFRSPVLVLIGIFGTVIAVGIGGSILMAALGLSPEVLP